MSLIARPSADQRDAGAHAAPVRVPLPIVLGAIVAVASILHAALALRSPSPWIVPDELIYSELARSIADGGLPSIRGEVSVPVGLGYPALLAAVWAFFDDPSSGYAAAKMLNALVLGATAVPAYLLARRFVPRTHALVVAGLSVAVPSMLYAGTLMTEVALYPAFVLAVLAIAVALERPTTRSQAAALGTIGLACAIKMLAAVLVVGYLAAIALYHWLDARDARRWRARMRDYATTLVGLAALAVAAGSVAVASGRSPRRALGAYDVVLENIDPASVPWWALLHVAELDLYLAVIPFAAALVVSARGLRSGAARHERLFVSLFAPVAALLVIAVGAFASTPFPGGAEYPENVSRLHERSTFVLAPLFLIGLAIVLRDRRDGHVVLATAVAGAALLPALIPLDDFDRNVRFQALALVPWVELRDDIAWPVGVLAFTFALAAIFVLAMRARAPSGVVLAPVVFVYVAVGLAAHVSMQEASEWTRSVTWGTAPDWVDAAVGPRAEVSVLWAEQPGHAFVELRPRHYVVFVGEFFNRSVGQVYELGSPLPYGLPATPVRMERGRVVLENGRPAPLGEFVLVPCHVRVVGAPVARDPSTGAVVVRVRPPVRAEVASPAACARVRSPGAG